MNQAKKYELISDYIDGNMTESQLEDFNKSLASNGELEEEIKEIRMVLEKIKSIDSLKLPDSFDLKLRKAIKAHNREQTFRYKIFSIFDNPIITTAGSVAAAVILVVVTTIFFSKQSEGTKDIYSPVDDFSYLEEESEKYPELDIDMTGNNDENTPKIKLDWE